MADQNTRAFDSILNCNFLVEIDGIQQLGFKKVEGLESTFGVIQERNGNERNRKRKQRGLETFPDITLTQGVTVNVGELSEWYKSGERKDIAIVELDSDRNESRRWTVESAFPISDKPVDILDAEAENEVAFQTMILAHEGIEQVS